MDNIKKEIIDCSVDRFKDILDFAPEGTIEIIKDLAVSLPLRDSFKVEALFEKTGFDAKKAMELFKDIDEVKEETTSKRRVAVDQPQTTSASKYSKVK